MQISCKIPQFLTVFIYCQLLLFTEAEGEKKCGYPGHPLNGYAVFGRNRSDVGHSLNQNGRVEKSDTFSEGDIVQYRCRDRFRLEGEETRRCLENGTWNGTLPHCRENLTKSANISFTGCNNKEDAAVLKDGDLDEIGYELTRTCNITFQWNESYAMDKVILFVKRPNPKRGNEKSFENMIVSIEMCQSTRDSSHLQGCWSLDLVANKTENVNSIETRIYSRANQEEPVKSFNVVFLKRSDNISGIIEILEIEIYATGQDYSCGHPEIPINQTVSWQEGDETVIYSSCECHQSQRQCRSGNWQSPSSREPMTRTTYFPSKSPSTPKSPSTSDLYSLLLVRDILLGFFSVVIFVLFLCFIALYRKLVLQLEKLSSDMNS